MSLQKKLRKNKRAVLNLCFEVLSKTSKIILLLDSDKWFTKLMLNKRNYKSQLKKAEFDTILIKNEEISIMVFGYSLVLLYNRI